MTTWTKPAQPVRGIETPLTSPEEPDMNTHGIDFDRVSTSDTAFRILTPSFCGYASRIAPGVASWRVVERDTNKELGEGVAPTAEDAIEKMTEVMAANV